MSPLAGLINKAIIAASTLTGKKFGLLIASSVVATSAVVASAVTNPEGSLSPLAALVGRSLAADAAPEEAAVPEEEAPIAESGSPEPTHSAVPSAPVGAPSAPAPETTPEEAPEESTEEEPTEEPAPEAGPVKHLFVINLVSPGYDGTFGEEGIVTMPYLNAKLVSEGELLTNYSLLDEGPVTNSVAAISGQKSDAKLKSNCPSFDACVFPVEETTVAGQLSAGRFTWSAYMEGMTDPATGKPGNCVYPAAEEPYAPAEGGYSPTRNPFVFFHSLLDLGDCAASDKPLTSLSADLAKKDKTPNYSYITPSLCNAGSVAECPEGKAGGPAAADAFLQEWVPKILSSAAYKEDGMLVITFNQLEPAGAVAPAAPPVSTQSLKVGTLLISRFLAPGSTDSKPYNPYSTLLSTEQLFGLGTLGEATSKKTKSYVTALFGSSGGD